MVIPRLRGFVFLVVLLAAAGVGEPASNDRVDIELEPTVPPQAVTQIEGVERNLYLDGRVYIGGQPTEAAIESFRDAGVTAVVNLRTPGEMNDRERVPYDEAAAVARLGMEYVWIPLGGDDHPYTPAAVDRFATVLAEHDGPVLLHCTMGWRAAYLWAAYLIQHHGYSLDDALARGEVIAIPPSPLERLLDRPLRVMFDE